ncbi:L-threonylcarbamoyladenylate synthase [Candidatus Parcubacteria bacterium]|nr:L-threonylcarbamoyladenylate synthase [Candidatus Parcubacteria bacterium]
MKDKVAVLKINDPKLVELFNSGKVVVIPTDTVYGLSVKANNEKAVEALYGLKNRESKPGTVIAASIDQLVELGIKRRYITAVADYWPGSISIEIPHGLGYLSQETGRQAFRVVSDPTLLKLLQGTGPLLTTSCNLPGQPPANNINEAMIYFGDKVAAYVDGGDLSGREPSTLIRIVDDVVEVIREGAVKIDESGRIIN